MSKTNKKTKLRKCRRQTKKLNLENVEDKQKKLNLGKGCKGKPQVFLI